MRTYRSVRALMLVFALIAGLVGSSVITAVSANTEIPIVARFDVVMTGAAEVPDPGDPDGSGTARIILVPSEGVVCYVLRVRNIAPATAAHIHVGAVDDFGPIVVPLDPPTFGASGNCVTADPELLADIAANPENYYVNVHNADFPPGAIRGQLA